MQNRAVCFERGNVEDLREKLQFLISQDDIVHRIRKDVSDYICTKYDWNDVVGQTLEVYRGKKRL